METENTTPGEGPLSESDDVDRQWAEREREISRFFYQLDLAVAEVQGYARGYAEAFGKALFPQAFNEAFNHTLDEDFDLAFKQAYNTSEITLHPATEADRDTQVLRLMTALACRTLDLELDGPRKVELARKSEPELVALLTTLANERCWPAQGRTEGEAMGRAEGKGAHLRFAASRVCEVFGIQLDDQKRQALTAMSETELETLLQTLARERRWPG
jgi:hypothetical protein